MKRLPRRRWLATLLALGALAVVSALPAAAAGPQAPDSLRNGPNGLNDMRRATVKYHDVRVAEADGYVPLPLLGNLCYSSGDPRVGAMGIHYVNPTLAGDSVIDPLRPELLVYFPRGGKLHLVAVEYFTADTGQPVPEVLGVPMHGPLTHLEPQIGPHYQLHFWLWQGNPAGIAAAHNPSLSCP